MAAAEENDLAWGWWSPGSQLWGDQGTYQAVAYEALPPLPKREGNAFSWLRAAPNAPDPLGVIDADDAPSVEDFVPTVDRLTAEARHLGLTVPPAFRTFMTERELHRRVPTCTACYLDLPSRLIALPDGQSGRLLRFLNDQQCCLLWYLHLRPGGDHTVVCADPEWEDDAKGESLEDLVTPRNLVVCAPSLEDFVHRFWLENTLW